MGKLSHKGLLALWRMNRRFKSLRKKNEIKKNDKIAASLGLPTSTEIKAKQTLIFVLTQIGAFKRAGIKEKNERN